MAYSSQLTHLGTLYRKGVADIRAELRCDVHGVVDEDADDQFVNLTVNVLLTGRTAHGMAKFAWHLDRDDGTTESKELHPRYHLQHAGHEMRADADSWGLALLMDPPRIMHPPLDGILAIDFVLGTYLPMRYNSKCANDPGYTTLVSTAQRRVWSGFAKAIASFNDTDSGWLGRCKPYWPQVLPREEDRRRVKILSAQSQ